VPGFEAAQVPEAERTAVAGDAGGGGGHVVVVLQGAGVGQPPGQRSNTIRLLCSEQKPSLSYTDKKENEIFLIYKEIQNGAVAKPYMRTFRGRAALYMRKCANI
jgi:hypothetical protein